MTPFEWRENIRQRYGIDAEIDTRERFLKSCRIVKDCWLWSRRGRFSIGRKTMRPSEMAYLMLVGPLAADDDVTTTCGDHKCCSPEHLVKDVSRKQFQQPFDCSTVSSTDLTK